MNPIKVKVTLSFKEVAIGNQPYQIVKVVNDIGVAITSDVSPARGDSAPRQATRYMVGDYLTEKQASELLYEPGLEVTTIPRKE